MKPNEPSSIEDIRKTFAIYQRRQTSLWMMGGLRTQFPTKESLTTHLNIELKKLEDAFLEKQRAIEAEKQRIIELENLRRKEVEKAADKIDDDWYIQYPDMKVALKPFQVKAAHKIYDILFKEDKAACALNGGVGIGKTFIILQVIKYLEMTKYYEGKTFAPWPYLIVTKASVVEQFKRVAKYAFNLDIVNRVMVTNYDQLRSTFGERFIKETTKIVEGEPVITFEWMQWIHPVFFVWDESHSLKNASSQQSLIGQAVNNIVSPLCKIKQVEMSATLWTRISDMKHFACSLKADIGMLAKRVDEAWDKQ